MIETAAELYEATIEQVITKVREQSPELAETIQHRWRSRLALAISDEKHTRYKPFERWEKTIDSTKTTATKPKSTNTPATRPSSSSIDANRSDLDSHDDSDSEDDLTIARAKFPESTIATEFRALRRKAKRRRSAVRDCYFCNGILHLYEGLTAYDAVTPKQQVYVRSGGDWKRGYIEDTAFDTVVVEVDGNSITVPDSRYFDIRVAKDYLFKECECQCFNSTMDTGLFDI